MGSRPDGNWGRHSGRRPITVVDSIDTQADSRVASSSVGGFHSQGRRTVVRRAFRRPVGRRPHLTPTTGGGPMARRLARRYLPAAVVVLSAMLLSAPARADTVTQWNQLVVSALAADSNQGSSAVV